MAATPAALAGLAIATTGAFAGSSAGKPVPNSELLCGLFMPANSDNLAGSSTEDHPDGSSSMGQTYVYTGQNCESENGQQGDGTYTWTITHSNVQTNPSNPNYERGTEHVQFTMDITGNRASGAQGHITNFDFNSGETGDQCGNRTIYYASGHQYDAGTCSPSSVGNFNTHGGAETGDHFRGNYGTVVYQYDNNMHNSPCEPGSANYCFQAILEGQTN
jgi:hypothetical protein